MATFKAVFTWESGDANVLTVGASAASTAQNAGTNQVFQIVGNGAFNLRFDATGSNLATVNSMQVPANTLVTFDAANYPYFSVYNPGGASISVRWIRVCRS
jgi:hypothetical protein